MLTVKRGLSPVVIALSAIVSTSSSQIGDQTCPLAVDQQLHAELGAQALVQLAGQVVQFLLGVPAGGPAAGGGPSAGGRRRTLVGPLHRQRRDDGADGHVGGDVL